VALSLRDGSVTWQADIAGDGDVGTPTVADGLVFAATGLGGDDDSAKGVAALDAAAGAIRWRYASPTQAQIYTPAVIDDRAYVVGHDQAVVALAAVTGEVVWRIETGAENEALPSVAAGVVYVPTNGGEVQALDSATGALLWTAEISGVPYAPVVTRGYVLVGTGVGTLFAIGGPK
jgi:outer membrane protein assembly factor BamB